MSENEPREPRIDIKITDEEQKGRYSNLLRITHTREEFILDFIHLVPPRPFRPGARWPDSTGS